MYGEIARCAGRSSAHSLDRGSMKGHSVEKLAAKILSGLAMVALYDAERQAHAPQSKG